MKKLSPLQNLLYMAGGILLVAGAALPLLSSVREAAPYVFSAGAVLFASMQMLARYNGDDWRIRRLRRQQLFGAILLLVTGALMLMKELRIGPSLADEWKITLTIAVVFEAYTAFRLPAAKE